MTLWADLKKNIVPVVLTIVALSCFLFNLGFTSLESFDEAWYGSISRTVASTGNFLSLEYNNQPFTDHPPLGFMLMAIPQFFLGSNEWTVRITSSILGALTVTLMYLIGKNLFSEKVGYYGAIFMLSSLWFVMRARSGNLDIPFLFFFLLVIFLITKKRLDLAIVATACLLLVKTLIGLAVLPVLVYILIRGGKKALFKSQLRPWLIFFTILIPWYAYNTFASENFLYDHFFKIGLRSESNQLSGITQLQTTLLYLQSGIGKWYKPALLALPLAAIFFFIKKEFRKPLLLLGIWLVSIAAPLLLSSKTEIWHLIPVYAPLFLSLAFVIWVIETELTKKIPVVKIAIPVLITLIAVLQLKSILTLVIPMSTQVSSEADISLAAKQYEGEIRLKSWFLPTSVYYSERPVDALGFRENAEAEIDSFVNDEAPDVFIFELGEEELISKYSLTKLYQNSKYVVAKDQ